MPKLDRERIIKGNEETKGIFLGKLKETKQEREELFIKANGEGRSAEDFEKEKRVQILKLYEFIFGILANRPEVKLYKMVHPEAIDTDFVFIDNQSLTQIIEQDQKIQEAIRQGWVKPLPKDCNPMNDFLFASTALEKLTGIPEILIDFSVATAVKTADKKIKTVVEESSETDDKNEKELTENDVKNTESKKKDTGNNPEKESENEDKEEIILPRGVPTADSNPAEEKENAGNDILLIDSRRKLSKALNDYIPSLAESVATDKESGNESPVTEFLRNSLIYLSATVIGFEIIEKNTNKVPGGLSCYMFIEKMKEEPVIAKIIKPFLDEICKEYQQEKEHFPDLFVTDLPTTQKFMEKMADYFVLDEFGKEMKKERDSQRNSGGGKGIGRAAGRGIGGRKAEGVPEADKPAGNEGEGGVAAGKAAGKATGKKGDNLPEVNNPAGK